MHELSIATALVSGVTDALSQAGEHRPVIAVTALIGDLSGVVPDALLFAWPIAAEGSRCEGAQLRINSSPGRVWCEGCQVETRLTQPPRFRCGTCNTPTPHVRGGREMELVSVELADEDTEPTDSPHHEDARQATTHP